MLQSTRRETLETLAIGINIKRMDFTQILAEYKGAVGKQKKKGPTWWKEEKWNKATTSTKGGKATGTRSYRAVEKSFCKIDHILSLSGKWEACF